MRPWRTTNYLLVNFTKLLLLALSDLKQIIALHLLVETGDISQVRDECQGNEMPVEEYVKPVIS